MPQNIRMPVPSLKPVLWNGLSQSVRQCNATASFKTALKTAYTIFDLISVQYAWKKNWAIEKCQGICPYKCTPKKISVDNNCLTQVVLFGD